MWCEGQSLNRRLPALQYRYIHFRQRITWVLGRRCCQAAHDYPGQGHWSSSGKHHRLVCSVAKAQISIEASSLKEDCHV